MDTSPAGWLNEPHRFGRRPDVTLKPATAPRERADAQAALAQHRAALAVSDALSERGLTAAWLAGQCGDNAEHLRRKLRGQARASLRDFAIWSEALNLPLGVTVEATE